MIKIIFFDVGNVLIKTIGKKSHEIAARILGVPHEKVFKVFRRHIYKVVEGRLSETEFWKIIGKELGISNKDIKKLLPIFKQRKIKVQKRVVDIAKKLEKAGYRIGILSDVIPSHIETIQRGGVYKYFDPVLLSCRMRVSKKRGVAAYQYAVRQAKVKYSEMIFFDDHKFLVDKAKKLGIKAFVYQNPDQLIRSLRKLGVKI